MDKSKILVAAAVLGVLAAFGTALYLLGPAGRGPRELKRVQQLVLKQGFVMTDAEATALFPHGAASDNARPDYERAIELYKKANPPVNMPDVQKETPDVTRFATLINPILAATEQGNAKPFLDWGRDLKQGLFSSPAQIQFMWKISELERWNAIRLRRQKNILGSLEAFRQNALLASRLADEPLLTNIFAQQEINKAVIDDAVATAARAPVTPEVVKKLEAIRAAITYRCDITQKSRLAVYLAEQTFRRFPSSMDFLNAYQSDDPDPVYAGGVTKVGMVRARISRSDLKTPGIMPLAHAKLLEKLMEQADLLGRPTSPRFEWIRQLDKFDNARLQDDHASSQIVNGLMQNAFELATTELDDRALVACFDTFIDILSAKVAAADPRALNLTLGEKTMPKSVHIDPYNDKPINVFYNIAKQSQSIKIYSVGRDGLDGKGEFAIGPPGSVTADIGIEVSFGSVAAVTHHRVMTPLRRPGHP